MQIIFVCSSQQFILFKFLKNQFKIEYKFFLNGGTHQVYIFDDSQILLRIIYIFHWDFYYH